MKFADSLQLASRHSKDTIIFAGSQLIGTRHSQEDYFSNFNDECVVVTDGVGGLPHGDVAASLAGETAIWGYKHVRLRPFYWADKRLLLKRIFRSSNLAVWQKRREDGYQAGIATTLSVAIIGPQKIWVGTVGDSPVFLFREGLIDELTPPDTDETGRLTNALGLKRLGVVPHIAVEPFVGGDILVMLSDGVSSFVDEQDIRIACELMGNTTQSATSALGELLEIAKRNGSTDNMTACFIKRLKNSEE